VPTPSPAPSAAPVTGLGDRWVEARAPAKPAGRPTGQIESVTAWGHGFVAVGRGCHFGRREFCEAIVWTSGNGRVWTRAPRQRALDPGFSIPTSGPEMGMFDVAAGGPGMVAIGYTSRPDLQATAWFSRDGVTWHRRRLGAANSARVNAVAWTGERFVIVGEDRSDLRSWRDLATATARAAVWTSTDGLTWTRVRHTRALDAGGFVDTLEDPITGGMRDVVAGGDGLVAVGSRCRSEPATCRPAAWTSPDGRTWRRVRDLPDGGGGVLKAVSLGGSAGTARYVAVGARSCGSTPTIEVSTCSALVLTSRDGRTWSRRPFEQAGDLRTVTWIGDRFYATAPDGPMTLWTSGGGARWGPADLRGGPDLAAQGQVMAWHLAATGRRAVLIGIPLERRSSRAWLSVGERR
jgi:hypothetical protein